MTTFVSARDLLSCLLALENSLTDQVQLVAALEACTCDRARPLAEDLAARGDLDHRPPFSVASGCCRRPRSRASESTQGIVSVCGWEFSPMAAHASPVRSSGTTLCLYSPSVPPLRNPVLMRRREASP